MRFDSTTHCGLRNLALALGLLLAAGAAGAEEAKILEDKVEADLNEGLGPVPEGLDRSTPRRSWQVVQEACRTGNTSRGLRLLNLLQLPPAERSAMGQVLFRQLCELLPRGRVTAPERLSDADVGPIADGRPLNHETVAEFTLPDGPKSLWLRRYGDQASGEQAWLLTRQSVSVIPGLHRTLVSHQELRAEAAGALNPGLMAPPPDLRFGNPAEVLASFVAAWRSDDMARAAQLLDLRAFAPDRQAAEGERRARRLGLLLARLAPGGFPGLSSDADGTPELGVPLDEERVVQTTVAEVPVELRLERHRLSTGGDRWMFAPASVAVIDDLYERLGYGWAGDHLPTGLFRTTLWDIQLWQWAGLLLGLALALGLAWLLARLTVWVLHGLARLTRWKWDDQVLPRMRAPVGMALWSLLASMLAGLLRLAEGPHQVLGQATTFLALLALGWALLRLLDGVADALQAVFRARGDSLGMSMIPVGRRILKPVVGGIVLIVALQNVGLNVSGLLAGLGIGGLALALAGKTTLENLFGSLTIAFDRPFKVGDWVEVGEHSGTVEDVGLRSTRLRTIERTLVTIPNGQLADSRVQNYSVRDRIRFFASFTLRYETTLDQLRYLVDAFKRYLVAHPRVWPEFHRVRFVGYNASSVDLEVFVYLATTDFHESTALREELLLDLGKIVLDAGVQFAFGSQTVYMGKDTPPDPQKAEALGREVRERQARGDLWLPEAPPRA